MRLSTAEMLRRLGDGQSIASVAADAGIARGAFDLWWKHETTARVPRADGLRRCGVHAAASIERDAWGIPHVSADNDDDLFFAFGYAMAQDRLFQLDYLRRKASGRLAEVLGPEGFELDLLARTVGIRRIAEVEWRTLPDETRRLLLAFTAGINALVEDSRERLPIEFDLLGYEPQPWSPVDCLAIQGDFRWYLTGRFPVIVIPELVRRALGDGPRYAAYLATEADEESILPAGSYPGVRCAAQSRDTPQEAGLRPRHPQPNDSSGGGNPLEGQGSNNWVLAGSRTTSGRPLLASDPHIGFAAVSCWYEVHLRGGSFNVAGSGYAGMPAVLFGGNERVAWGITNNICSQRDLYQERTDAAHPGCFLFDGKWEQARSLEEVIQVRGSAAVRKAIQFSRNGPIVDEVLPAPARSSGPVSLAWLGAAPCGWLTSLLAMNRAQSAEELREATRPWLVPTFNLVFADVDGHVGYQCTGRLPIRNVRERGYRPGWDPAHQWGGLIPFEGMPRLSDPVQGFVASANNRPARDDFPYPLSGTWSSGYRARRVREMIERQDRLGGDDCARMQHDVLSLRAQTCVPRLLTLLEPSIDCRVREAAQYLREWDYFMETDRVAASLFDVFFTRWTQAVAHERLPAELAALAADAVAGLAAELLADDPTGWFAEGKRERAAQEAFASALDLLAGRFGPDISQWTWGRLHQIHSPHVLSRRGELAELLDQPPRPVKGDTVTVSNTASDANWNAVTGAGYRLLVDFAATPPRLLAVEAASQSGHPGSPHYADQMDAWLSGGYHPVSLAPLSEPSSRLVFEPSEALSSGGRQD